MADGIYKVVSSKTIRAARFEIVEDEIEINGRGAKYSFVKIPSGICAVVETPEGFILQKEYRYPIKAWSYEFTAGTIDDGETPDEAAVREISEETGYVVDELIPLGEFYPSFGPTDECIHLFYAKCARHREAALDYTESISCEAVSKNRIEDLIKNGDFRHGAGLACWLKYKLIIE